MALKCSIVEQNRGFFAEEWQWRIHDCLISLVAQTLWVCDIRGKWEASNCKRSCLHLLWVEAANGYQFLCMLWAHRPSRHLSNFKRDSSQFFVFISLIGFSVEVLINNCKCTKSRFCSTMSESAAKIPLLLEDIASWDFSLTSTPESRHSTVDRIFINFAIWVMTQAGTNPSWMAYAQPITHKLSSSTWRIKNWDLDDCYPLKNAMLPVTVEPGTSYPVCWMMVFL